MLRLWVGNGLHAGFDTDGSEDARARTSDTGQETGRATTCYAVQCVLLFPLVCNDGLGGSERCAHGSCKMRMTVSINDRDSQMVRTDRKNR